MKSIIEKQQLQRKKTGIKSWLNDVKSKRKKNVKVNPTSGVRLRVYIQIFHSDRNIELFVTCLVLVSKTESCALG